MDKRNKTTQNYISIWCFCHFLSIIDWLQIKWAKKKKWNRKRKIRWEFCEERKISSATNQPKIDRQAERVNIYSWNWHFDTKLSTQFIHYHLVVWKLTFQFSLNRFGPNKREISRRLEEDRTEELSIKSIVK